jgi:plasmid stabilization system protein ParE
VKVVFAEPARADLIEIADYIARRNPQRARSFVQELRAVAAQLGAMPEAYSLVARMAGRGIRRRPFGFSIGSRPTASPPCASCMALETTRPCSEARSGVAYSAQRVDEVPADSRDEPLDLVLTELGVI